MASLPWEMTAEILKPIAGKGPAALGAHFRCVSKQWRSLIDGHDFIKKHLNHSLQTNSNHGLILKGTHYQYFSCVELNTLDRAVKLPDRPVNKNLIRFPLEVPEC